MYDTIVIGAGAAGMTAALNVLRNGKTVLIIEKELIGGQIANSPRVENFPSIKEISGEEFSTNLFDQVTYLGADFELEEVLSIEKSVDIFIDIELWMIELCVILIKIFQNHFMSAFIICSDMHSI